jgi:hypothetical protein
MRQGSPQAALRFLLPDLPAAQVGAQPPTALLFVPDMPAARMSELPTSQLCPLCVFGHRSGGHGGTGCGQPLRQCRALGALAQELRHARGLG